MKAQIKHSREKILGAAVVVACKVGLQKMTRENVARKAGIGATSESKITFQFGGMAQLRTAVVEHAVEQEILPIVAEALSMGHPSASRATAALKKRAALSLLS